MYDYISVLSAGSSLPTQINGGIGSTTEGSVTLQAIWECKHFGWPCSTLKFLFEWNITWQYVYMRISTFLIIFLFRWQKWSRCCRRNEPSESLHHLYYEPEMLKLNKPLHYLEINSFCIFRSQVEVLLCGIDSCKCPSNIEILGAPERSLSIDWTDSKLNPYAVVQTRMVCVPQERGDLIFWPHLLW